MTDHATIVLDLTGELPVGNKESGVSSKKRKSNEGLQALCEYADEAEKQSEEQIDVDEYLTTVEQLSSPKKPKLDQEPAPEFFVIWFAGETSSPVFVIPAEKFSPDETNVMRTRWLEMRNFDKDELELKQLKSYKEVEDDDPVAVSCKLLDRFFKYTPGIRPEFGQYEQPDFSFERSLPGRSILWKFRTE